MQKKIEITKENNTLNMTLSFKNIAISIIILTIIIGGGIFLFSSTKSDNSTIGIATQENGKQIINIAAKTGFTPANFQIKASEASILRISTDSTYDCSSTIVIPSLNISKSLPSTGITNIDIPEQKSGTIINFTCGMGMYKGSLKVV